MTAPRVQGLVPLPSKRFGLLDAVEADPAAVQRLIERYGSPLHLIDPGAMQANAAELVAAAEGAGVDLRLFFARKANKSHALMREALRLGHGLDVASEGELEQAVSAGARADDLIITAAVKSPRLLQRARELGARPALDHQQEAVAWAEAADAGAPTPVAVRLAPRLPAGIPTRFGMAAEEILEVARDPRLAGTIDGVQFHVDGYGAGDRAVAAHQALELIDGLRELGHPVAFLDIGGGIPMRYVDDVEAWDRFWAEHRAALTDPARPSLTFRRHGLGLTAAGGQVHGRPAVYPVAQQLVRGEWLAAVLASPVEGALAEALRRRGLRLHAEPGRALLDGCGVTVARVAFTKAAIDGTPLVGLEMNRTQLRSAADDFLVDPVVLRAPGGPPGGPPSTAYLVGAYCIERELITWRAMRFPAGAEPGDLLVFPNTAGYLMHIVESPSHGMPLASNVVVDPAATDWSGSALRDESDAVPLVRP